MFRRPAQRFTALFVLVPLLASCGGGTAPPPEPGTSRGTSPILDGRRVILLPVQRVGGVPGNASAELSHALTDRGQDVEWVLWSEVDDALARSPGMDARTSGLPVGLFGAAEVERVGDPLFGQLRRMGGLVDADLILLPVSVTWETNPAVIGATPRVRFTAALIAARTGHVVWYGVEEGDDHPRDDPRGLATAAERLSESLLWYVRRGPRG